jgi:tape measure domain-containing protein
MAELGTAYITIMPSTKGMAKQIQNELGDAGDSGGKRAGGSFASSFESVLRGSAIGAALGGALSKAVGAIGGSLGAAVSRLDTLDNYPKVMTSLNVATDEADGSISMMSDRLQNLPTRLDAMASSVQGIYSAAKPFGVSLTTATKAGLAFNDMMLAGGQGTAVAEAAMEQFRQMLTKNKPDMQDWKSLLAAAPGQMDQLAKSMLGPTATANDLYTALGGGGAEATVTMGQLLDALVSLDTEGGAGLASFKSQAEDATGGVKTSFENMCNAIPRGMVNVMKAIGEDNIVAALNLARQGINDTFSGITSSVGGFVSGFTSTFDLEGFKQLFKGFADAFNRGFDGGVAATDWGSTVGNALNRVVSALKVATPFFELLGKAAQALGKAMQFLLDHIELLVAALVGLKVAKAVAGLIQATGMAASKSGGAAGDGAPKWLQLAAAFALVGAGTWLIADAFSVLAATAVALSQSGTAAIATFALMSVAMVGLVAMVALLAPKTQEAAMGTLALGAACLMVGVAALAVATAFAMMVDASIALSAAGAGAQAAFAAICAVVLALVTVLIVSAPLLTANAVGLVALAAAATAVGVAVLLACTGLALLATQLPTISQCGASAAVGTLALSGAVAALGVAAMVCGAGMLALGVALAASGVAALVMTAAMTALAVLLALCSAGMAALDAATLAAAPAAMVLSTALLAMSPGALAAAAALPAAAAGAAAFAGSAATAVAAAAPLAAAAGECASKLYNVNEASSAAQGTVNNMCTSLSTARDQSNSLNDALGRIPGVADTAGSAFDGLGSSVSSAMSRAVSAVRSGVDDMRRAADVQITIPTIKVAGIPHFSMSGGFDPETGAVPSVSVRYYARGGIFRHAAVFGERYPEVATPLSKHGVQPWADAITESMDGVGRRLVVQKVTQNIYERDDAYVAGTIAARTLMHAAQGA